MPRSGYRPFNQSPASTRVRERFRTLLDAVTEQITQERQAMPKNFYREVGGIPRERRDPARGWRARAEREWIKRGNVSKSRCKACGSRGHSFSQCPGLRRMAVGLLLVALMAGPSWALPACTAAWQLVPIRGGSTVGLTEWIVFGPGQN